MALDTLADLRTEFFARGFDYLNQDAAGRTRADTWLNEAYLEDICADEPWDFLKDTETGTAPLTITDLDTVLSVKDTDNDVPLTGADEAWLENTYYDLAQDGRAEWYYLTDDTTLATYPASSDTIQVRYFKVPAELSGDSDVPLVPPRWRGLIVDFAAIRAYWDTDNPDMADRLEQRALRRLLKMRLAHMVRDPSPRMVQATHYLGW